LWIAGITFKDYSGNVSNKNNAGIFLVGIFWTRLEAQDI
jgi:hypothetical protein